MSGVEFSGVLCGASYEFNGSLWRSGSNAKFSGKIWGWGGFERSRASTGFCARKCFWAKKTPVRMISLVFSRKMIWTGGGGRKNLKTCPLGGTGTKIEFPRKPPNKASPRPVSNHPRVSDRPARSMCFVSPLASGAFPDNC